MPKEFFEMKARAVFAESGGDPECADALARWGQDVADHRADEIQRLGVLVAQDGTLLAETMRHRGPELSTVYVATMLDESLDPLGVEGTVMDMARAECVRQTGQAVIHVPAWQVVRGAGLAQHHEQPMSAAEIAGWRSLLGLTHEEMAARLINRFGRAVNPRTVRDWESGREQVSRAIADQVEQLGAEHDALVQQMIASDKPVQLRRRGQGGGWEIAAFGRAQQQHPGLRADWIDS